jgi:hypothetical protein
VLLVKWDDLVKKLKRHLQREARKAGTIKLFDSADDTHLRYAVVEAAGMYGGTQALDWMAEHATLQNR